MGVDVHVFGGLGLDKAYHYQSLGRRRRPPSHHQNQKNVATLTEQSGRQAKEASVRLRLQLQHILNNIHQ